MAIIPSAITNYFKKHYKDLELSQTEISSFNSFWNQREVLKCIDNYSENISIEVVNENGEKETGAYVRCDFQLSLEDDLSYSIGRKSIFALTYYEYKNMPMFMGIVEECFVTNEHYLSVTRHKQNASKLYRVDSDTSLPINLNLFSTKKIDNDELNINISNPEVLSTISKAKKSLMKMGFEFLNKQNDIDFYGENNSNRYDDDVEINSPRLKALEPDITKSNFYNKQQNIIWFIKGKELDDTFPKIINNTKCGDWSTKGLFKCALEYPQYYKFLEQIK